jgi:hypothetical protein
MADEKELGFKISDHRMFNPDGTLRQPEAESAEAATEPPPAGPTDTAEAGKLFSFPSEPDRRKQQAERGRSPENRVPAVGAPAVPAASPFNPNPRMGSGPDFGPEEFPEASFTGLVNMLAVEAVMYLGLMENPMGGGRSVDLEAARHVIDMLAMLEQKTSGNLSPQEDGLLRDVLADLRMQFVAVSRRR